MDSGTMAQWAAVFVSVTFSLAAMVLAWINRRSDKIEAVEATCDALDKRLATVETEVKHLPNVDLVHELQLTMAEMRGEMKTLLARVEPIKAISERLQNWALEGHAK
ncbi:hypothetical protein CCR94_16370 [Rhodoblastus sphagnicola]|uniref:DUF2730 domain-containing protein n=1 Tax=Rhodoblastus sphagnicola TaxID=333368 RepID=A0A2S6N2W0_9HYPH|nr:DUF2730 family protein [Rhodoblastus sphagnicola]MBB4199070.1 hypothetical protein [Rhodoblastus sphagnicola]PPQ28965.1 hypothetical protein CCR94_16370 [Rhodoblastus sphagnicola]